MSPVKDISKLVKDCPLRMLITKDAEERADSFIRENHMIVEEPDVRNRVLIRSAVLFIKGDYMTHSAWFKAHDTHHFMGFQRRDSDTNKKTHGVWLSLRLGENKTCTIMTPDEANLGDDYLVTRVIEETKILYRHILDKKDEG